MEPSVTDLETTALEKLDRLLAQDRFELPHVEVGRAAVRELARRAEQGDERERTEIYDQGYADAEARAVAAEADRDRLANQLPGALASEQRIVMDDTHAEVLCDHSAWRQAEADRDRLQAELAAGKTMLRQFSSDSKEHLTDTVATALDSFAFQKSRAEEAQTLRDALERLRREAENELRRQGCLCLYSRCPIHGESEGKLAAAARAALATPDTPPNFSEMRDAEAAWATPDTPPICTCPAGSYDYPNSVHTDYCALAATDTPPDAPTEEYREDDLHDRECAR
jgi:hypothetical protein